MFAGKNYWIIGASTGIGAELAKELSRRGAKIALSARGKESLKKIEKELSGEGHIVAPLDVSDSAACAKTARHVSQKFGDIDSVIFMAASYVSDSTQLEDIEVVKKLIDINFTGAFNVVLPSLEIFKKQQYGQIVICASVAGYRGLPGGQPYCASKAGLISYAESLYIENKAKNIDVKVICPGFVKTRLTDKNKFEMPMIITPEEAAKEIVKGLESSSFEIHFPKKFTYIMKFVRHLPNCLYLWLGKQMLKKV
jgi:short-subunit dehydrogenase